MFLEAEPQRDAGDGISCLVFDGTNVRIAVRNGKLIETKIAQNSSQNPRRAAVFYIFWRVNPPNRPQGRC